MKTKSFIIITVLTGFLSSQLCAQVDTTKNKKSKSDTSTHKRDTAWKKDTNQVNLNNNPQDDRQGRIETNNPIKKSEVITNRFFMRENKNLWRRTRVQAYSGSC